MRLDKKYDLYIRQNAKATHVTTMHAKSPMQAFALMVHSPKSGGKKKNKT